MKLMALDPLRRFYKTVAVVKDSGGFRVTLDERHLKTPAKRDLLLPSEKLAKALAEEWDAQKEKINPLTMPYMALASTAIDRIGQWRDGVIDQIAKYAETDLICYRTIEPEDLAQRQAEAWNHFLEWAKENYNAEFNVHTGVLHIAQPEESLKAIYNAIKAHNDWELAALSIATHCTGSVIIGLALMQNHITPLEAFHASQVDETYQIEQWGEDWETADRRELIQKDLDSVVSYLKLLS
jgi:chaperone required for assembly of F1-ATPase